MTLLNSAKHKNVIEIDGYLYYKNIPGIIMELMPFGSLSTLFQCRLTELLCHRICCDIASGISYLHTLKDKERLVHGDLKPENIVLSESLRCKITDFGVANMAAYSTSQSTGSESSTANTSGNSDAITRIYAAPEILNQVCQQKRPCDVYSFSIIVLEVVGWKRPGRDPRLISSFLEKVKDPEKKIYSFSEIKYVQDAMTGQNNTAKKIISSLTDVIEQCNQFYPRRRPKMEDVEKKLLEIWNTCDTSQIDKDVDRLTSSELSRNFNFEQEHIKKPLQDYMQEFYKGFHRPGKML